MSTPEVALEAFSHTDSACCNGKSKVKLVQDSLEEIPPILKVDSASVPLAARKLTRIMSPLKTVPVFRFNVRLYLPGGRINGPGGPTQNSGVMELAE